MAATVTTDTMNACVTCVVCGDMKKAQKFLECLHPCCVECLRNVKSRGFTCPKCSCVTQSLMELHENFLQDCVQQEGKSTQERICVMCKASGKGNRNIGKYVIFECEGAILCEDCLKMYSALPITRGHRPKAIEDITEEDLNKFEGLSSINKTPSCKEHHSAEDPQPLLYYCKDCQVAACQTCLLTKHSINCCSGNHEIVNMKDYALETKQVMTIEKEILQQMRDDIVKNCEFEMDKDVGDTYWGDTYWGKLNGKVKRLKELLGQKFDELANELQKKASNSAPDKADPPVSSDAGAPNNLKCGIEHIINVTDTMMTSCPDDQLIRHHKFIACKIHYFAQNAETEFRRKPLDLSLMEDGLDLLARDLLGRIEDITSVLSVGLNKSPRVC